MDRYKKSNREKIFYLIGIIFPWGLIVLFRNNPTLTLFPILVSFGFGLLSLYGFIKSFVQITLTDYSIKVKYPFSNEKEVRFDSINLIADLNTTGILVLKDYNGNKLLSIDKSIIGIQELKEQIKIHLKETYIKPGEYFRKQMSFFIANISLLLIGLFIIGYFIHFNKIPIALFGLLCFGINLYNLSKRPLAIYLSPNIFRIKKTFYSKNISIDEIKEIKQESVNDGKNSYILIKLKQGKDIILYDFVPDDELLFRSCNYYLNNRINTYS